MTDLVDRLHDNGQVRPSICEVGQWPPGQFLGIPGMMSSGRPVLPGREESEEISAILRIPIQMITRINGVVSRIQWHPRAKMLVVHLDWQRGTQKCFFTTYETAVWAPQVTCEPDHIQTIRELVLWFLCGFENLTDPAWVPEHCVAEEGQKLHLLDCQGNPVCKVCRRRIRHFTWWLREFLNVHELRKNILSSSFQKCHGRVR